MKQILTIAILLIGLSAQAQTSAKVVIDRRTGEVVGEYKGETATKFHISAQDDGYVTKAGHRVVVYSAAKGQGIVEVKDWGTVCIRKAPSTSAPVVSKVTYEQGDCPPTLQCLGLSKGWYKVKDDSGHIGYIKVTFVKWNWADLC